MFITFDGLCSLDFDSLLGGLRKQSSVDYAKVSTEHLPDSEFALLCNGPTGALVRRFPMATPDMAKVSSAQLVGYSNVLPDSLRSGVAAALRDRLKDFGEEPPLLLMKISGPVSRTHWDWLPEWDELALEGAAQKTSAAAPRPPLVHAFEVGANPLIPEHEPVVIEIRSQEDADKVRDWTVQNRFKASSYSTATLAEGVLTAYEKMGTDLKSPWAQAYLSDLMKLSAGAVRFGASFQLADRDDALDQIKVSETMREAGPEMVKAYRAVLSEVRRLESAGKPLPEDKARSYATKLSHLDEALGIQSPTRAFEAFFFSGPEKRSEASPSVYAQNATIIRESDLERLKTANLKGLIDLLGEDTVEALREDPVQTFKGLNTIQQRWMANWIQDFALHPIGQTHLGVSY